MIIVGAVHIFTRHKFNQKKKINLEQDAFNLFYFWLCLLDVHLLERRSAVSSLFFFICFSPPPLMSFGDYRASWCQSERNQCPAAACPESNNRWTRAGVTGDYSLGHGKLKPTQDFKSLNYAMK